LKKILKFIFGCVFFGLKFLPVAHGETYKPTVIRELNDDGCYERAYLGSQPKHFALKRFLVGVADFYDFGSGQKLFEAGTSSGERIWFSPDDSVTAYNSVYLDRYGRLNYALEVYDFNAQKQVLHTDHFFKGFSPNS